MARRTPGDRVNKPARALCLVLAAVAVLAGAAAWLHANQLVHDSRAQRIATTLEPLAVLLSENQAILKELQPESSIESDAAILEAYLTEIRRDGVSKHAAMKQRLDQLAENNTAIVTLIKAYSPEARTPAFRAEADRFRNYAAAWRDRWNGVMELFMAGGNYVASEVPFPQRFPDAVKAEIDATR
jgi:hypothetical protein